MNKELKRVSTVVLLMFLALFVSTSVIQVASVDSLKADPRNSRTLYDSFSAERGPILVDGVAIAESTPVDDAFSYLRTYSNGPLYAPVTGYFTLNQGNTGVEGSLNDYLSGSANEQFLNKLYGIITGQDPKGAAVETTIDASVQQAAWDALGSNSGAVVAIVPQTGEILAMVSKESFDPNLLAVHKTSEVIASYEALSADAGKPLVNRAIGGDLYPPGSVFKIIMTAAALESGEYTPESEFPNPPRLTLPESSNVIRNAGGSNCGGGENASIATALRLSCNIPFAQLGLALGNERVRDMAEGFGFGTSFDLPMASTPSQYPQTASDAEQMLSSFGQASDRVTPLQMAMVSAAVANGGTVMQPTVVEKILGPDLTVLQQFEPTVFNNPISPENADIIKQMMVDGVANGAASNARISGVDVGGKTGTAENGGSRPYTLWFTGFAPADNPQVAVAVVVENGGGLGQSAFGNQIAAPIAKKVIEAVLSR
ncbi:penicillin-binding protein 2 [Glaciihabitans arcticus]|uniref:Penicillin-binding protein 2 n=1 Tax=Glaciihabitans arcticus TaxID=2668039 RepID=A0A4V2JFC0_9MICO|nr:penicillin-binding protein 2 [Glaciihabitans arcticus]TBN58159.1 penicillin-binding protein 2 [Glaciihabitans arcticus]